MAKQYTFDGGTVDSFYDDNKIFKMLSSEMDRVFGSIKDTEEKKKLAEELFDSLVEEGVVTKDTTTDQLFDYLETEAGWDFWEEKVLDVLAEAIDATGEWYEEYQKSEEYWGDLTYVAYEGTFGFEGSELPEEVVEDMTAAGKTMDDLVDYLKDNKYGYDVNISVDYMNGVSEEDFIVLFASQIGEVEYQFDGFDMDNLSDEEAEYVNRKIDYYVKGDFLYVDLSYYIVSMYVDWDDIKDDFLGLNKED